MKPEYQICPLRSSDLPEVAAIHVEGWQTAYAGFIPAHYLQQITVAEQFDSLQTWLEDPHSPPKGFTARVADQVIGFILAGASNDIEISCDTEIYKLFIRPAFQRIGIGRALIQAAAELLKNQGNRTVAIWAFEEAASSEYYRRLGGQEIFRTVQTVGGRETPVIVYSWELTDLVQKTKP